MPGAVAQGELDDTSAARAETKAAAKAPRGRKKKTEECQIAAGEVLNALPVIFHNPSVDRHETDARIAANTTSLHCWRLVEPGWIDPDFLEHTFSCSASRCRDLQSIYVSNRAHRSIIHLKDNEFVDITGFKRQRKVSFVWLQEVRLFFLQNGRKIRRYG